MSQCLFLHSLNCPRYFLGFTSGLHCILFRQPPPHTTLGVSEVDTPCVYFRPVSLVSLLIFYFISFCRCSCRTSLTSMTNSERSSISRGCERDQVGTSLSSLGNKSWLACNRTSVLTEKHPLLFALNGCCPFTYADPRPQSWLFFIFCSSLFF